MDYQTIKQNVMSFSAVFLTGVIFCFATSAHADPLTAGQKAKEKGVILSRSGDLVKIQESKTGNISYLKLTDATKIERTRGKFEFFRHTNMDLTALVPGVTVEAEGVGNNLGQLEAEKINFNPDVFAVEVAEEQQVLGNTSATQKAQTSADQAQDTADKAQSTADRAGAVAESAGEVGVANAAAIRMVNKRVSDLDEYRSVAEAEVYFPNDGSTLDAAARKDLDILAASVTNVNGYLIEVDGYASKTGSEKLNQKLSEDRAASVVDYLRNQDNIPMRRILAPAGYGATHSAAENQDSQGRALNRRVDVKVLVNVAEQAQARQ